MSRQAIISLLWGAQHEVLQRFVRQQGAMTILSLPNLISDELMTSLGAEGAEVVDLMALLDASERQAAQDSAERDWLSLRDQLKAEDGQEVESSFASSILETLQGDLPGVTLLLAALERAMEQYSILLVVVNEDMQLAGKTLVNWAKDQKIASLHLAHVLALSDPYTVHAHLQADILAVYGERGCEGYLDLGISPDRLRVTGNPAWDGYPQWRIQRADIRQAICAQHGRSVAQPIVVFGTTWSANLTALGNEHLYGDTLLVFLDACEQLRRAGWQFTSVIKDRPANAHFGSHRCAELLAELGANTENYLHTSDNGREWLLAADVLVAVDSNYSVEAMLAGTPAINLLNMPGTLLGPTFDAASGILEVESSELASALGELLTNADRRRAMVAEMDARAPYYNAGVDGLATERVARLMGELLPPESVRKDYVWQTHLDVSVSDVEAAYHQAAREELLGAFASPPKLLLDIGCAAGATSGLFKQRFPKSQVWGIEVNESAAKIAAERLDRVLIGKFEDFDLQAEGIEAGTLDGVILGDVLEHLYNPWAVMKALQPLLSPDAQLVISIPNVRNFYLMSELAQGYWKYEGAGLLDVTHIRFFTLAEFRRFLFETGYHVDTLNYLLDGRLAQAYHDNKDQQDATLQIGNLSLSNLQPEDIAELCSLQFLIRARVGRSQDDLTRRYAGSTAIMATAVDTAITVAAPPKGGEKSSDQADNYQSWLQQRTLSPARQNIYRQALLEDRRLRFQAVVVGAGEGLQETLLSLKGQLYPVDDIVQIADISDSLATWQAAAANSDIDWTLRLMAGDLLESDAILRMAECLVLSTGIQALYCDEDQRTASGSENPVFRPALNLDLLRSFPYTGRFLALGRSALLNSAPSLPGMGEAFLQDLLLQQIEQHGLGSVVQLPYVLYHAVQPFSDWLSNLPREAPQAVVAAHLARLGLNARVEPAAPAFVSRIHYELPTPAPLVSILILAESGVEEIASCLESILTNTKYSGYEVLIGRPRAVGTAMRHWLDGIVALAVTTLRVVDADDRNALAERAEGDCLVMLDAGCLCLDAGWLKELVGHVSRPEVGAAGAKLVDRASHIVRSGLVFGLRGPVGNLFEGERDDQGGYLHRLQVVQNFSAVDGLCLAIRRDVFRSLAGFSAQLPSSSAAADLCARLGTAGYLVVWTPFARLGWESTQPRKSLDETSQNQLYRRWVEQLKRPDPAYNPNLALEATDFVREIEPDNLWRPLPWRPLPVVQVLPGDQWGCGQYRMIQPFRAMEEALLIDGNLQMRYLNAANQARIQADSIVVQRQLSDEQLSEMRRLKQLTSSFLVYELDDLLHNIPLKSVHYDELPRAQITRSVRMALSIVDRVVVSTPALAEALQGLNDDIVVMPNRLPVHWWKGVQGGRRTGKPRVGWAGGSSHAGDLQIIADVIKALANEVEWVFMGMPPPGVQVQEYHEGVAIDAFPAKLASLDLDLALAPLEMNRFNECKSNLRLLEMGACGFPVIATDIEPYRCGLPVTLVRNRFKDWRDAIRDHLVDRDLARAKGAELRADIHREWMLEGENLLAWRAAWLPG
ncbi:methyltransferase domain-containing protein [Pseudomonas oryzihabitans]|uniref:methyltransferase domain-containing protein n=1 Tax=Pseudomonas oryzihabitans TaxID=47885 RepID=UPI0028621443|nr:methyltransferase domain-containing protein [Pseudomonas psychrotolerans]MDR6679597.1 2-polyprenyl-3-methyl-5-hydroxy-6-metoxy-1,4-benzoquinol methylase/glycosyltransferase involved in cell wall biosynthesis [Pseudomonas psychrotolerans]